MLTGIIIYLIPIILFMIFILAIEFERSRTAVIILRLAKAGIDAKTAGERLANFARHIRKWQQRGEG